MLSGTGRSDEPWAQASRSSTDALAMRELGPPAAEQQPSAPRSSHRHAAHSGAQWHTLRLFGRGRHPGSFEEGTQDKRYL